MIPLSGRALRTVLPLTALLLAGSHPPGSLRLSVHPAEALFDQPVSIQVRGAEPGGRVTLTLETKDGAGVPWKSSAVFRADSSGLVDPGRSAPLGGDYGRVDAMGLFWAMRPSGGDAGAFSNPALAARPIAELSPVSYTLTARASDGSTATTTVRRRVVAPGVTETPIRGDGLVADLFLPAGAKSGPARPALITFGGAEGGLSGGDAYARWLASHGFVALAVAWYHAPGLKQDLVDVPVTEIAERAVRELASRPFVDADGIGLMGGSWGGTVALAAASHLPDVHAVVSWVGSPVPFPGIARDPKTGAFRATDRAPFVVGDSAVSFVDFATVSAFLRKKDEKLVDPALLPIWRIRGPVLLVGGSDDRLGISGPMAEVGIRALRAHRHGFDDRSIVYEDAGHLIYPGYQPTAHRGDAVPGVPPVGGTRDGYARADAEMGRQTLDFLRGALGAPPPRAGPPPDRP